MTLWTITLGYTDTAVLAASLERYNATTIMETKHILVDHHWPIDPWTTRHSILMLAEKYNMTVITPYKNLGGHGGFSWALRQLPLRHEDYVICYDSDSNPLTLGWDHAMRRVLDIDPTIGYLSLMPEGIQSRDDWSKEMISLFEVWTPGTVDMFNVTMFRASFLAKTGGIVSDLTKYYGHIEVAMAKRASELGLRHGYLADHKEGHPIVSNKSVYNQWKRDHASRRYSGNFDEYLNRGV